MLTIFGGHFEIGAVQKYANLVDLGESFPTSIYLQNSASIQPRTSPSKFGEKFNSLFTSLLRETPLSRLSWAAASKPASPSADSETTQKSASELPAPRWTSTAPRSLVGRAMATCSLHEQRQHIIQQCMQTANDLKHICVQQPVLACSSTL